MSTERTDILVCVGCGGVFYHGITQMALFCERHPEVQVVLMDDDVIEERNGERQWPARAGESKVQAGRNLLMKMGVMATGRKMRFTAEGIAKVIGEVRCGVLPRRVYLVGAPDNHLCRWEIAKACAGLSGAANVELVGVVAGNSETDGYAYGGLWHRDEGVRGDWSQRHPDIQKDAEEELAELQNPMPCGSLAEVPVQTAGGNGLTGQLMWKVVEACAQGFPLEMYWAVQDDGSVRIWSKMWQAPVRNMDYENESAGVA